MPVLFANRAFVILLLLIGSFMARGQDTAAITRLMDRASAFHVDTPEELDSSLFYLNQAMVLAQDVGSFSHLYAIYDHYNRIFQKSGNYSLALDYLFQMMTLLDRESTGKYDTISALRRYASLYTQVGICYFNMDNFKAMDYYNQSLETVRKLSVIDPGYPARQREVIIFLNMGSAYLSNYQFSEAEDYFVKALDLNASLDNPNTEGSIYNNLGIVYKEKKDHDKALRFYEKALAIRQALKDTAGMAQTYNNLGDAYVLMGRFRDAIEVLNTAYLMSLQTGNLVSQMKAANFLSTAYEKTGNYPGALEMYRISNTLRDSLFNNETVQNSVRLEMQYQHEKQLRENELQQQIVLARKERQALIYLVIMGLSAFSVIVLVLLYRNQRMRIRQAALEKQQLEMELDFRNKELSTHVLYLLKKNEFISAIVQKLMALVKSDMDEKGREAWIQEILREMKSNIDNTVWNEFEVRFQQVHKEFYQKLMQKYPDLTPNEIKICAFLKLNMTSKDISAITFQSVKSLEVARHRLRKKMGIDRDDNLVSILQNL